ncbi:MAG: GWxTD domain-containing protein [Gemmatimonadota bacterium]|nr:GWxTD domain-containing protein [Gemmatimonadota bacterium]
MDRQSARKALDVAIRLDPQNGDYQLMYGEILGKQGLWLNAERHYERVCETHPERFAEAAYMVGFFAMQAFLKYIDMEHIDIVTGGGPPTYHLFRWEEFGGRDREKALEFLTKSITSDPGNRLAYFDLGLIHFESKNPKGLAIASKLCLDQYPEDTDALLYCGLGYQGMGEWETAHEYYMRALEVMSTEERALMESVDLIASPGEKSAPDSISTTDTIRVRGTDNRERVRFWRKRDPLYLTAFSERRLEHYGRVAYANLRYGQRLKGIPGWQTDRGKAHIKFGRALNRKATRLEIPGGVDSFEGKFGRNVKGGDEIWFYKGFSISFYNSDGLDSWRFDTRPGRVSGRYTFHNEPSHYLDPFRLSKYRIPYQAASFKDGDTCRVELAYALPRYNVSASDADSGFVLENGVFVFGEDWDEVYRKRSDLNLSWPELTSSGYPVADSLRNSHLVFQLAFKVPAGTYHLVGEVRDKKKGSIGTFGEERGFATVDTSLAMSDLLLATQIETGSAFPERRSHLNVVANPLRTYHRSEPAFIYLELYNLKRDEYGRTDYEISYRIGRPGEDEIDPYLFMAQRLPENGKSSGVAQVSVTRNERLEVMEVKEVREPDDDEQAMRIKELARSREGLETTVTSHYEGYREDDFTYLQIDLGHVPAGVHRLSVRIKDANSGQIATREALLRVIE